MTTHFRTLLLLGFTALASGLGGCVVETTSDQGGSSCAASRYFDLVWFADNGVGTARQPCAATPNTSVELVLGSGTTYIVDGFCDDSLNYNWRGSTPGGLPIGDYVASFRLLRTDTRAELSRGDTFPGPSSANPAMPACGFVALTYEFPLM